MTAPDLEARAVFARAFQLAETRHSGETDDFRTGYLSGYIEATREGKRIAVAELKSLVGEAIIDDEAMHVRARAGRRIAELQLEIDREGA